MPTGVAMYDARERLFAAAERVLLRDGPGALTSRAVTAEAAVAKGLLHRHFEDFDAFLAELALARIAELDLQGALLLGSAGTGTVADHLTDALVAVFDPVARAIVALVSGREAVRERLRRTTPAGIPVLAEATAMLARYLAAERALGRIPADADVDTLALTLIGGAHLRFAGRAGTPLDVDEARRIVASALG